MTTADPAGHADAASRDAASVDSAPVDSTHEPRVEVGPLADPKISALTPPPSQILAFLDSGVPAQFEAGIERFLERLGQVAGLGPGSLKILRVEGGEPQKTMTAWQQRIDDCQREGLDRDAVLVAIGGGAVGDAIGFPASTWHRGIRWIAVPTTLVAMVDAHLGGKTALNHGDRKNQLGTFWWPESIDSDPSFLVTLPEHELRSGWGELIKSAYIGDSELFRALESSPPVTAEGRLRVPTAEEIARGAAVKRAIVAQDPRETDRRRVLNFGHTLGHALETLPGARSTHGEAVGTGMMFAARLAVERGVCTSEEAMRLVRFLSRLGFAPEWPTDRTAELLDRIAADKKNRGGRVHMVLPVCPGEVTMAPIATEDLIRCLERGAEWATPEVRRGEGIE